MMLDAIKAVGQEQAVKKARIVLRNYFNAQDKVRPGDDVTLDLVDSVMAGYLEKSRDVITVRLSEKQMEIDVIPVMHRNDGTNFAALYKVRKIRKCGEKRQ